MKNNHTPGVRFPGFAKDWEQRQLNEYLTTSKVKNKDERFGKEDVLSVSGDAGIVNQIQFHGRSFAGVSVAPYGVVEMGDVVYTKSPLKSNPFGIIKTNRGQAGIVSTLYAVYKPYDNVDAEFVERYFENDQRLNRYLKPLVNKGAKNDMKVSDDNALIGSVVFPVEVDEQRKVSLFFNQLENLLTLHQQELTTLKQTKKGFLQKMFPKEGESVPEIRFPGFTGEWRGRKLGSHAEILTGGTPKTQINEYWEPSEIPWMSSGEINKKRLSSTDNMISTLGFENSSARWVKEKSILIALAGQGKTRGTVATNQIPLTTNQSIAAIVPTDELHYEFVFQNLENRYSELRLMSSGDGTRGGLNKKIISDIVIISPTIEEQAKIGDFFKQLDDTIRLQQQELDALKETKKAFLQKMLV